MGNNTEADAIAALAIKGATATPHIITHPDGRSWMCTPHADGDWAVNEMSDPHNLDLVPPRYIKQAVTVHTAASLVGYVKNFGGDATTLFADVTADSVTARLDYHRKETASYNAHAATLKLRKSLEWQLWAGMSDKYVDQLEFARFLEENQSDIVSVDTATILEAVRSLQATRTVNCTKVVRTETDNSLFTFSDGTTATTNGAELPSRFMVKLPVYYGCEDISVVVLLRWRVDKEHKLTLGIKLARAEHVRQAAFDAVVEWIEEQAGLTAVHGA